jgi:hypothetical protein
MARPSRPIFLYFCIYLCWKYIPVLLLDMKRYTGEHRVRAPFWPSGIFVQNFVLLFMPLFLLVNDVTPMPLLSLRPCT